jgi:predicted transcriptional regulator
MTNPQKILLGTATCKDLMQCMMNLGGMEMDILRILMRRGPLGTDELTKRSKKDKSIVHRGLQRLMSSGLVSREKRSIPKGGYYYVYSSIPPDKVKKRMRECIDTMYSNMRELVDNFDVFEDEKGGRKRR